MAVKQAPDLERFHFLLPADLKARAEVMAKARDRKLAAEARLALEDRCKEFEAETEPAK